MAHINLDPKRRTRTAGTVTAVLRSVSSARGDCQTVPVRIAARATIRMEVSVLTTMD